MTASTWLGWLSGRTNTTRRRPSPSRRWRAQLGEQFEARLLLAVIPPSELSINNVSVMGPNTGTATLEFTVTLNPPNFERTVTVDFASADGTAQAGVDYTPVSGTLTFLPDDTQKVIDVPILADSLEPNDPFLQNFTVTLSNPTNAIIAPGQGVGTGTIDDTNTAGALQFSTSDYVVNNDQTQALVTVIRTGGGGAGVTVNFATGNGTAVPGVDYTPVSGTLTFGQSVLSQSFVVPITPNLLLGPDKTVPLILSNAGGGSFIGPRGQATLTIHNVNSLVVTNTNDAGPGSLRRAIRVSDANPGANTITFAIPGAGPFTIAPLSPLPDVTDPATIDATTQPGFAGVPIVALDGALAGSQANGLELLAGNSTVKGLAIGRFAGSGIIIAGAGGNTITGDYLGTDITGTQARGNQNDGVTIINSAQNTIGGLTSALRDVLSGNAFVGVRILGSGATGNVVEGDFIGTDASGTEALGNVFDGVFIDQAAGNVIGGQQEGARNVISGNHEVGLQILGSTATNNVVWGNLIGTDVTGTQALPNGFDGIWLNGAPGNTIGGASVAERNVIAGNGLNGIRITGAGATGNRIEANFIGVDATGGRALGNLFDGIFIDNAPGNTVGDPNGQFGNVISGNGSVGVQIFGPGATGNVVQGNLIGTDVTGLVGVGNRADGVFLNAAPGNIIGGLMPGAGNVISANGSAGVQIFTAGATGNVIEGNKIGTNINGQPRLGNAFGLFLNRAGSNTIVGNLIAGNRVANVFAGSGMSTSSATRAVRQVQSQGARTVARRGLRRHG